MNLKLNGWHLNVAEDLAAEWAAITPFVTAQRASEAKNWQVPAVDPLAGLGNYRAFTKTVELEIRRSSRSGRDFAILIFNLTGTEQINYSRYLAHDRALCRLVRIFSFSCRIID